MEGCSPADALSFWTIQQKHALIESVHGCAPATVVGWAAETTLNGVADDDILILDERCEPHGLCIHTACCLQSMLCNQNALRC